MLSILGTIHHMIIICGTQVQNDHISRCFFMFFKILIFWVIRRVKGQKWSKMTKNSVFALYISGIIHHMILIYGITCVKG